MTGLLEREKELARIGQALGQTRAGRGGALLIWGLAGIGRDSSSVVISMARQSSASRAPPYSVGTDRPNRPIAAAPEMMRSGDVEVSAVDVLGVRADLPLGEVAQGRAQQAVIPARADVLQRREPARDAGQPQVGLHRVGRAAAREEAAGWSCAADASSAATGWPLEAAHSAIARPASLCEYAHTM